MRLELSNKECIAVSGLYFRVPRTFWSLGGVPAISVKSPAH